MRGRLLLAGLCVFTSLTPALAQFPPQAAPRPATSLPPARSPAPYQPATPPVQGPRFPDLPRPSSQPASRLPGSYPVIPAGGSMPVPQPAPRPLPPSVTAPLVVQPDGTVTPPVAADVPLPQPEAKVALDAGAVTLKRVGGNWQVWAGQRVLKSLGDDNTGAEDVVRVMRELHPTEWVTIGTPRPVVEYGLTNGKPAVTAGFPRQVVPIDLRSVRVEPVKGVWCLRDDGNILFNFGLHKADADQALAVVRRYGFNRIGMVGGTVTAPALTYFFVALEADGARPPAINPLTAAAQENALARTGIPVPGVGYVGEMVRIDSRRVEVKRDGANWLVMSGGEVLGAFGYDELAARDAARVIQDGRFTEFCRVGAGGLTFFLAGGRAPTRAPLSAQGRRFDLNALKVTALGQRLAVTEQGRLLFDVGSAEEGEAVIRLLRHFGFDQVCQVGRSPRASLTFLVKTR